MRLSLGEIVQYLALEPEALFGEISDVTITQAAYDSREIPEDALFVAIKGDRTDGHNFVQAAVKNGAKAILAERYTENVAIPQLIVQDSVKALGQIAHYVRKKTKATVIGVTGTSGKTTVKEALANVFRQAGKTLVTPRNLNTQIGLPISILGSSGDEKYWVLECGISHPKDMDELGAILEPDIALILNVGPGHTQGLGDLGVAWHKTRLLTHLAEGGQAVVSGDYPELVWKAIGTHIERLNFFSIKPGVAGTSSYLGEYLGEGSEGYSRYKISLPKSQFEVEAPFRGIYGAENCIAVAAVASLLNIPNDLIIQGLHTLKLPAQRFNQYQLKNWRIIDDTYNANPLSMERMLQASKREGEDFVVVLGEMRELGSQAESLHKELGQLLAQIKPKAIFWKGGLGESVQKGLSQEGATIPLIFLTEPQDFRQQLQEANISQDSSGTIIFKGSRANALERYVDEFKQMLAAKD